MKNKNENIRNYVSGKGVFFAVIDVGILIAAKLI